MKKKKKKKKKKEFKKSYVSSRPLYMCVIIVYITTALLFRLY